MKNLFSNTKLVLALFMSVALFSTSCNKDDDDPKPQENYYIVDGNKIAITTDMFWYTSPMGGDPYLRLISEVDGQDNPDLLKIYLKTGVDGNLEATFTWDGTQSEEDTYDAGYSANYAGMSYDWTAIGKTGSDKLTVKKEGDKYSFIGKIKLSVGKYDWSTGEFNETGEKELELSYIGALLEKQPK
ncbi:MAG: hypothetical protein KAG37_00030 [Flavobacteriales bacterium]|nr:hypothetical protein [Flavobacteriales bacterium]